MNADKEGTVERDPPRPDASPCRSYPCSSAFIRGSIVFSLFFIDMIAGLGLGHAVVEDVGPVVAAVALVAVWQDVAVGGGGQRLVLGLGDLLAGELGEAADGVALVDLDQ